MMHMLITSYVWKQFLNSKHFNLKKLNQINAKNPSWDVIFAENYFLQGLGEKNSDLVKLNK